MKRVLLLLALGCFACAPMSQTSPGGLAGPSSTDPTPQVSPQPTPYPTPWPKHQDVETYTLLHIWYSPIPETYPKDGEWPAWWLRWIWPPHADDPYKTIPGAPWMREISSGAYPLTGPYDSRNEDILRWQIRQAKAAGLDGFFIPVYSWDDKLGYLDDMFFGNEAQGRTGMLCLAAEQNFKVAIEGWGVFGDIERKSGPWKDAIARHLTALETSRCKDAYIRIADRPAYWIHLPDGWMSRRELMDFLDGTDEQPRRVSWVMRPSPKNTVININALLHRSRLQFISWYDDPTTKGFRFNQNFAGDLSDVRAHQAQYDMVPIAHAYTGYDERMGVDQLPTQRYGERSIIPTFLAESKRAGARIILFESFNEWGELSQIEAGLNIKRWRDMGQEPDLYLDEQGADAPYKYLDILRTFNGMQEWVPPKPPPCSAVDPLILSHQNDLPESVRCIPDASTSGRNRQGM